MTTKETCKHCEQCFDRSTMSHHHWNITRQEPDGDLKVLSSLTGWLCEQCEGDSTVDDLMEGYLIDKIFDSENDKWADRD